MPEHILSGYRTKDIQHRNVPCTVNHCWLLLLQILTLCQLTCPDRWKVALLLHTTVTKMFVFQVSKVLHPGLLQAATRGICTFKISNMIAEFFALSILACWVAKQIVKFNILGVHTKVTQISFYLSFSRWSFTKNHFKSCQQTANTVCMITSLTSSPASEQLLFMLSTNYLQDKITQHQIKWISRP